MDVFGTRYYLENKEMNIITVRTCGKNARRKNCDENVEEYPGMKRKIRWKSQEIDGLTMLKMT
jgi:hypothetical protein